MSTARPTYRVFISSSFRDLRAERDILQERTFPNLRRFCEEHEARFQAVDLRWGISEEAGENQQIMNICLEELYRCQRITPRPNFILLLGDRYGWRPLPAQIFEGEFQRLSVNMTSEEAELLNRWYKLDDNAVPGEYVLQPRSRGSDFDEHALRHILQRAAKVLTPQQRYKYFESATHQEIRHGILEAPGAEEHVFCYFRDLQALPAPDADTAQDYLDLIKEPGAGDNPVTKHDWAAHEALLRLKGDLETTFQQQVLDHPHMRRYAIEDVDSIPSYLDQLAADIEADLKHIIGEQLAAASAEQTVASDTKLHEQFGRERCQHFEGREEFLQRIRNYAADRGSRQPLAIIGAGGSGKTALLAKAASELKQTSPAAVIVSRYIGTTSSASDIRLLLQSLCREIKTEFADEAASAEDDGSSTSQDFQELVKEFENCLALATPAKPLVLVLDALDQINPTDGAEYLSWIPWQKLPENARLITSVLQPAADGDTNTPAARSYRVVTDRVPAENLIHLTAMSRHQGKRLLQAWLDHAGRRLLPWERPDIPAGLDGVRRTGRELTTEQAKDILDKFEQHGLPLWLKLAFEEVRRWHSYSKLPTGHDDIPGLSEGVAGVLRDLFARLEEVPNHGELFVRRALGYLAAGRRGLTEDELIDVLSQDEQVMNNFIERSPTELEKEEADRLTKLPMLIWSRLYSDLEPYLSERAAFGATVLSFYHRQVAEEIANRYLTGDDQIHCHRQLAAYFGNDDQRPYFLESLEDQQKRARTLPPTPRPVNIRKVDELPYHVLQIAKLVGKDNPQAEEWDAVANLLTNWQFLEAKAEARP